MRCVKYHTILNEYSEQFTIVINIYGNQNVYNASKINQH